MATVTPGIRVRQRMPSIAHGKENGVKPRYVLSSRRFVQAGAICWIGTVQFFIAAHLASAAAVPAYDGTRQLLSDLGIRACTILTSGEFFCSPRHVLFAATLVLQGILMMFGTVFAGRILPNRFTAHMFFAAGFSLLGISAFPEDGNRALHQCFAAIHCVCANIGLLGCGIGYVRAAAAPGRFGIPKTGWAITAAGFVGAFASIALTGASAISGWAGLVERIAVYPFPAVLIVLGINILVRQRP